MTTQDRTEESGATFGMLTADERTALTAKLASATAACSGRQIGRIFTETDAERRAYGAVGDEIRSLRDEVWPS